MALSLDKRRKKEKGKRFIHFTVSGIQGLALKLVQL
jgi:hypothetical protein